MKIPANNDFAGGYYLVQEHNIVPAGLAAPLVTVSSCHCQIYPGEWALPWVNDTRKRALEQAVLELSEVDMHAMSQWVDHQMTMGEFWWPNVFANTTTAREFHHRYLGALPRQSIHLIGSGLSEPYLTRYLSLNTPEEGLGECGVYHNLLRRLPMQPDGRFLGFDILRVEQWGIFESFICGKLLVKFRELLGITLNESNLITHWEDAVRAAAYAEGDGYDEPGFWFPWRVMEYPLIGEAIQV